MNVGASLMLIAAGAILRYAVTARTGWIDLQTTGAILMAIGIVGFLVSVFFLTRSRGGVGPPDEGVRPPNAPDGV